MTKYIYKELEIVRLREKYNDDLLKDEEGTIVHIYENDKQYQVFEVEFKSGLQQLTSADVEPIHEKLIIECDCHSHMLKVVNYVAENNEQDIYFAMFNYGNCKRSLWRRIRLAWRMIWKDEVYDDQLIFNRKEANKLKEFLNNIL